MLSAADLTYMKGVQAEALTDTCTWTDHAKTSDGEGGRTSAGTARGTALACRLGEPTASERRRLDAHLTAERYAMLTLPAATTGVGIGDTFVLTSTGETWRVVWVLSLGSLTTALRLAVERI